MDSISQFWGQQSASLNRESGDEFYRKKAQEHRDIIGDLDANAGILDLGCGAGELLEHLIPLAKVSAGLDYSQLMLDAARERLNGRFNLELLSADVFTYLPQSHHRIWTTTGALNQYLDAKQIGQVLEIFSNNRDAEAFYLFDCIDPLRYQLLLLGISYRPEHMPPAKAVTAARRFARRILTAARLALGGFSKPVAYLGTPSMGYGQRPDFWLQQCASLGLSVEIVSSRYYEYRFHTIIRKGR